MLVVVRLLSWRALFAGLLFSAWIGICSVSAFVLGGVVVVVLTIVLAMELSRRVKKDVIGLVIMVYPVFCFLWWVRSFGVCVRWGCCCLPVGFALGWSVAALAVSNNVVRQGCVRYGSRLVCLSTGMLRESHCVSEFVARRLPTRDWRVGGGIGVFDGLRVVFPFVVRDFVLLPGSRLRCCLRGIVLSVMLCLVGVQVLVW